MISAIVDAAGRYYRTVLGALVFLLIFGTFAFVALPKESMPDIPSRAPMSRFLIKD